MANPQPRKTPPPHGLAAALTPDQVRALVPGLGRNGAYAWIRERLPFVEVGGRIYVHRLWVDLELLGLDSRGIQEALRQRFGEVGLLQVVQELERLAAPAAAPELRELPGGRAVAP